MSYSLVKKERLSFGLKRITLEELDCSLKALSDQSKNIDEEIHAARKHFKKIRALLRLMRYSLGEEKFRQFNTTIRDSARNLAPARNSAVTLKTFDELLLSVKEDSQYSPVFRELLADEYNSNKLKKGESVKLVRETRKMLRLLRGEIHSVPLQGEDFDIMDKGLRTIYSQCRKYFNDTKLLSSDFMLHEWRKYVKYLLYTIKILLKAWPAYFKAVSKELEELSENLGDINDLSMLEKKINETAVEPAAAELYINEIRIKKRFLIKKAIEAGDRLLLEKPKQFTDRIEGLYKLWKTSPVNRGVRGF